ncbi:hypothetical protein B0H13DRAFT_2362208 [Mycena leptocephala]|nr:hypothetical protein B0H13DRAFT_2362208 [Mycena leptocephala]
MDKGMTPGKITTLGTHERGRKLELRMIGESGANNVGASLWCQRSPFTFCALDTRLSPHYLVSHSQFHTPHLHACGVGVLHEQRLTQMGVVWMEGFDACRQGRHRARLLYSPEPYTVDKKCAVCAKRYGTFRASPTRKVVLAPKLKVKATAGARGVQDERPLSEHGRRPWSRWMGSRKWARPRMRSARDDVDNNTRNVDGKPGGGRGGSYCEASELYTAPDCPGRKYGSRIRDEESRRTGSAHDDDSAPPRTRGGGSSEKRGRHP